MPSKLGTWGELQAVRYLEAKGYEILDRNYKVFEGEIDVIAIESGRIHFVEVKTRASMQFGSPEHSLNLNKQRRLLKAGFDYLDCHSIEGWRFQFDLIAVECTRARKLIRLTHYENVIGMDCMG